jgi:hypothetical protein
MDANTPPQLKIFYKLGILMTILPYISKYYDDWADFMWKICYPARLSWYKYEMAFLNKFLECDFDFDDEIKLMLGQHNIDDFPTMDENYSLTLKPTAQNRNVRNFLAYAKTTRFRKLKSLKFTSLESLDVIGTRYANKFLKFGTPKSIEYVYLEAKYGSMKTYLNSICLLAPRVQEKILLSKFIIQKSELIKVSFA